MNKITVEQLLTNSFVISIDDVRLARFNKLFQTHRLLPIPQKFQGICKQENTGPQNCLASHKEVVLRAKQLDLPFVCIFEDDAYPCNGIYQELEKCLNSMPNKCKLLIFGYSFLKCGKPFDDNLLSNANCYGSHAYMVFKDMYDAFIAYLDNVGTADCYRVRRNKVFHSDLIFASSKNIFIQYTPISGIHSYAKGYIWHIPTETGRENASHEFIFNHGYSPIESILI